MVTPFSHLTGFRMSGCKGLDMGRDSGRYRVDGFDRCRLWPDVGTNTKIWQWELKKIKRNYSHQISYMSPFKGLFDGDFVQKIVGFDG